MKGVGCKGYELWCRRLGGERLGSGSGSGLSYGYGLGYG